ncbi:transposase [Lactococcus lactis subsp. lactis IO-1]|nr:transposase [Lactococcus lactis subsp. lactis IO-1]
MFIHISQNSLKIISKINSLHTSTFNELKRASFSILFWVWFCFLSDYIGLRKTKIALLNDF